VLAIRNNKALQDIHARFLLMNDAGAGVFLFPGESIAKLFPFVIRYLTATGNTAWR